MSGFTQRSNWAILKPVLGVCTMFQYCSSRKQWGWVHYRLACTQASHPMYIRYDLITRRYSSAGSVEIICSHCPSVWSCSRQSPHIQQLHWVFRVHLSEQVLWQRFLLCHYVASSTSMVLFCIMFVLCHLSCSEPAIHAMYLYEHSKFLATAVMVFSSQPFHFTIWYGR